MSGIGGYFELELGFNEKGFHHSFIRVNSCRNALLLLILNRQYNKLFIPYYTCDAIVNVLIKNNIQIEYYSIDESFEIIDELRCESNEAVLYTNYFGLKDEYINLIASRYNNLIIDNAQAFYSKPVNGLDTIYSPRKFFGVPDGGLLSSQKAIEIDIYPKDLSHNRISHLLKRKELEAEDGYEDYRKSEEIIDKLPILRMSNLTETLLSHINYKEAKEKRLQNFNILKSELESQNELRIEIKELECPLAYPFLTKNGSKLKRMLIEKRIFVPTYWTEVLGRVKKESIETRLVEDLLILPIDQRYNGNHMNEILKAILE